MMAKHLGLTKVVLKRTTSKLMHVETTLMDTQAQLAEKDKMLHETLTLVEQNQWPMKIASDASKSVYGTPTLPLVIRVTGVTRKQRQRHDWYSNGFLTNVGGYKLRLKVDLAGSRHTHMAIYTEIMPGPMDNSLPWPIRGKFVVELLNQLSDNNHYKKTWLYDSTAEPSVSCRVHHGDMAYCWGIPSFISLERLRSVTATCQYMKDNCIYFRVSYQRL